MCNIGFYDEKFYLIFGADDELLFTYLIEDAKSFILLLLKVIKILGLDINN